VTGKPLARSIARGVSIPGSGIAEPVERSAENGMDVFGLRDRVIGDYTDYVRSFIRIKDPRIARYVDEQLGQGRLWPDPLVQ
jgi:hypothetical protein